MPQTIFTPATFATVGIPGVVLSNEKDIRRGLLKAAHEGKRLVIDEIQNAKPRPAIDTGELARSYRVIKHADGWILRSVAKHAPFMEHGTKPHTAPFAPLLAWATRKVRGSSKAKQSQAKKRTGSRRQNQRPKKATTTKGSQTMSAKRRAAQRAKQQQIDAMVLARRAWIAIRRRGIQGRHFHATASQKFGGLAAKHVQRELRRPAR
jgi:hypothetical protein